VDESSWIEIRPLPTGKFEAGNLRHVLKMLYNNGKPFRFFIANCPSSLVEGRRSVKFFLELTDRNLAEYLAKYMRATTNVEVLEAKPPRQTYSECVEFQMECHYGLPMCEVGEKCMENPVDAIVACLSMIENAAFEVTAVADPKAAAGIRDYKARLTGEKKTPDQIAVDIIVGILDGMISGFTGSAPSKPKDKRSRKDGGLPPEIKTKVEAAQKKIFEDLFTCTVKAYGQKETLKRINEALPGALNAFKPYKTTKISVAPTKLKRPNRVPVENILNRLSWITPLLLILTAIYFNIVNPLRLNTFDILVTAAAISSGVPFQLMFRRRNPIVLSADELSMITSLPMRTRTLPVELGKTVQTRGYLPAFELEKSGPENWKSPYTSRARMLLSSD
jgi:hypothetical protein